MAGRWGVNGLEMKKALPTTHKIGSPLPHTINVHTLRQYEGSTKPMNSRSPVPATCGVTGMFL
jgi:hypothetical protein